MRRSDFHFDLPPALIAQRPLPERSASRLLTLDGPSGALADRTFQDLPDLLRPGDLLVFNNTRVIPARLFGHKASGGRVEILIERLLDAQQAMALIRASKAPRAGTRILLPDGAAIEVLGREDDLYRLRALEGTLTGLLARHGHVPLPPYIERADDATDQSRYQTVYATRDGAVAAPTAGLHFDQALLGRLAARGVETAQVTLHVGAGTFQPVRVDDLAQHRMHAEWLEVDAAVCAAVARTRARGGRVVAVGTTSVRSLEGAFAAGLAAERATDRAVGQAQNQPVEQGADHGDTQNPGHPSALRPYQGDTRLFIRPGFRFRVVDAMITNFHLPESTLLMLVCAFAGYDPVMAAYRHAVDARYRFFSYGDAMFLTRRPAGADSWR